ncbi:hypothetical protein Tco_0847211 [Tanacetum coccineum]
MVPRAVLMKYGLVLINTAKQNISKTAVLVNTARQVNTAHSKTIVNAARPMSYLSKTAHSTVKRPIHKNTTFKTQEPQRRKITGKAKKSVKLMMEKLFRMEFELMLRDGFEQIVDFFNAYPVKYALTVNPTIYTSCIEQFWSTVKVKTINGESQLHALVDDMKIIITESSVRRDIQLADAEDEVVHKELGDSLVRAATTAVSLEAEQDSGNITKTQSKATPNESSSQETTSGGGPRCQETMGDTIAQTRFENVSKHSNDPLLASPLLPGWTV